jgi:hypothetical protein
MALSMLCVPPDAAKDAEGEQKESRRIDMPRSNSGKVSVVESGRPSWWSICKASVQRRSFLGRKSRRYTENSAECKAQSEKCKVKSQSQKSKIQKSRIKKYVHGFTLTVAGHCSRGQGEIGQLLVERTTWSECTTKTPTPA